MTMKKQLVIAAAALLTLGTAFSDTIRNEAMAPASASVGSAVDVSSRATAQVVTMWKEQAKSNSSTHLSRPL